ncbi:MAG TPA: Uma2 family endonuclease [Tepidisphaeraceae bacterium]|nr:Uma2 family endonuclease [Tepidisphaeraceae bacterium]
MKGAVAKRVKWTVDDYFRVSETGVFADRRVELLNGEIIEVPAQANPHRFAISKTTRLLVAAFAPQTHWVVIQGTLRLSKFNAPDPDFHVSDVPEGSPDHRLPMPILVVEISDTTYRKDAGPKLRAYARAGIGDYWIVNLPEQRVEVYRGPENPTGKRAGWRYATTAHRGRGESVSPLARPDLSFDVDAILP